MIQVWSVKIQLCVHDLLGFNMKNLQVEIEGSFMQPSLQCQKLRILFPTILDKV